MEILKIVFILLVSRCIGGKIVNLALYKPTVMSSILYIDHPGELAVDGNLKTTLYKTTCTNSKLEDPAPFWIVDLQGTFSIVSVMLTNNAGKNSNKLLNFAIDIFTKNPQGNAAAVPELCTNYTGDALNSGETRTFTCPLPITGRFVRIKKWKILNEQDRLVLCDVQVFGQTIDRRPWVPFYKTPGTRMRSQNIEIMNNCITVQCASYCHRNGGCLAFNYNLALQMCELLLEPKFAAKLESNSDWSYYGPDL